MLLLMLCLPSLSLLSLSSFPASLPVTLFARRDVKKLPVSPRLTAFNISMQLIWISILTAGDGCPGLPAASARKFSARLSPPPLCPLHPVVAVQFCGRCFMGSCCEFLDFLVLFLDKPHITLHSGANAMSEMEFTIYCIELYCVYCIY